MKIIFLDIDGVLNSNDWYVHRQDNVPMDSIHAQYPLYEFDPRAVARLNELTEKTGAKIVLSSTWRIGRTYEQIQSIFDMVGIKGELVGATPSMQTKRPYEDKEGYTTPRGCEIDWWLKIEGKFQRINWSREKQQEYIDKAIVKNYVILDDDSDMLFGQREHFVHTPFMHGLMDKHAEKCIEILNKDLVQLYYQ
jgi:hypothetical protein